MSKSTAGHTNQCVQFLYCGSTDRCSKTRTPSRIGDHAL